MLEVSEEEERDLSEVAEEKFVFEEEYQGGGEVVCSWERVGRVLFLVKSWDGSIGTSNADSFVTGL